MHHCVKAVIAAIVLCFFSCDRDKYKLVSSSDEFATPGNQRDDTIIKKENNNDYFSRLYKPNSNGLISRYTIPDSISEWDFKVLFSGRARTNYAYSNAAILVAVMSEDKTAQVWTPMMLRYYFTETDQWCNFKDSMTFKREAWQKKNYYVNVFAYLGNSEKENFDIDNLSVQILAKQK